MLDAARVREDLDELRYHWGSAYMILWTDGRFIAQRRDTYKTVSAQDASELFARIHEDYFAKPVPRR